MTPGTRVRHTRSRAQGIVRWESIGQVLVIWDNPLSSPPSWVNAFHLEVVR